MITGATSLNVPSRPHQHRRRPLLMPRIKRIKRPATTHLPNDDSDDDSPDELATTAHAASDDSDDDSDDSDDDDTPDEFAELRAKEAQRLARRRAANARYRARHPERVAAQRQSYRARHPERVAAQKQRYRARHPEREAARRQRYRARHPERVAAQRRRQCWNKKCEGIPLTNEDDEMAELRTSQPRYRTRYAVRIAEQKRRDDEKHRAERLAYYRRYYQTHREWIRRYQAQYHKSERGRAVWPKRRKLCALAHARGPAERQRTMEKFQALGPLSLTVSVEDFMQGFWDSLSPAQEDSVDLVSPRSSEAMTTTMDMDSGVLHPLDSSCDMWDDGKGFLDNLLEEELSDLPSPSDDSLYGLLRYLGPWSPQDSDFDLEDFLS